MAEEIVDSFYKLLTKGIKEAPPTIKVGEPFKNVVTNKVHVAAWQRDDLWWIVTSDTNYGYIGSVDPWKEYAAPTRAAGPKLVNKNGWVEGDRVSLLRTKRVYTVLAVTEKSVLIQGEYDTRPQAEPNDSMSKYFTREQAPVKLF